MAVSREEIIEALKEMSLLEASELVKDIEETFGVSAAAPVAVAAAPAAAAVMSPAPPAATPTILPLAAEENISTPVMVAARVLDTLMPDAPG